MERLGLPVLLGAATWATLMLACSAIFAESPPDEPPRYCTVFNHFAKSGGSTVKSQLAKSSITEGCKLPGLITGVQRTTPQMRLNTVYNDSVIVGYTEMIRRPLEEAGRDCEYFTMMRHPIDRLVSAFFYCPTDHDVQDRPSKWCGNSEGETGSLEDRLMEFAKAKVGNRAYLVMMHSFLCDPGFELCDAAHARDVTKRPRDLTTVEGRQIHDGIKRVLGTFTAVGIFEQWELSMRLFDATVKSPVRRWNSPLAVNPGSRSPEREHLLEWAHTNADLHSLVSADLLLYEYALSLFRKQTRDALGVAFA